MMEYSIGFVARVTGLTVECLRVWERRYGVVRPGRDRRGRLYSEADVERLRLLKQAVDLGHPIGRIAELSSAELARLLSDGAGLVAGARRSELPPVAGAAGAAGVEEAEGAEGAAASGVGAHDGAAGGGAARGGAVSSHVPQLAGSGGVSPDDEPLDLGVLMAQLRSYRTAALERRLGDLALSLTPRQFVFRLVLPLMQHVGEAWCAGRLGMSEEHALSGVVSGLLASLTRQHADPAAPVRLVFATPVGERHHIGLQCAALLAASARFGVVQLGADLPAAEIARAAKRSAATAVVIGNVHAPAKREIARLVAELPTSTELWVGGAAAESCAVTRSPRDAQVAPEPRMAGGGRAAPLDGRAASRSGARVVYLLDMAAFERELTRRRALDRLF